MTDTSRTGSGGAPCDVSRLVILAGPTASGKSALAMRLAARLGGTIVNADAMQCYAGLRILTARPTEEDEAHIPHRLYGVLRAQTPGSAAWWRGAATRAIAAVRAEGRIPILCGGTGLYLAGLLCGIAEIPEIPPAARAEARALLAELGPAALHARLRAVDPATAARLRPQDSQRLARAFEVWRGTGKGLSHWLSRPATPLTGYAPRLILLDPPRAELGAAIERRFAAMLEAGALAEPEALLASHPDPALPLLRAHGVPELTEHLQGRIDLETAKNRVVAATRRYTKRQATWFRHQRLVDSADMRIIHSRMGDFAQQSDSYLSDLENFINAPG